MTGTDVGVFVRKTTKIDKETVIFNDLLFCLISQDVHKYLVRISYHVLVKQVDQHATVMLVFCYNDL